MPSGPWDNVQLAPPPSAPSYAAPLLGPALGQMLGSLPQDFQQGQQYARLRAQQTALADPNSPLSQALAKAGIDRNSLYGQLAVLGGAETVAPLAQRLQQGQVYNSIMGGSGGGGDIYGAILGQESGNRDNVGDSSAGAIGPAQIMPATFNQYARKGEDIRDPATNRAVGKRIVDDYQQRYNGDPARIATAYYSGPGNVAPAGSPTPWIENKQPKGGPSVSQYVNQVIGRMPVGQQPASAQSVDQGGPSTTSDRSSSAFRSATRRNSPPASKAMLTRCARAPVHWPHRDSRQRPARRNWTERTKFLGRRRTSENGSPIAQPSNTASASRARRKPSALPLKLVASASPR